MDDKTLIMECEEVNVKIEPGFPGQVQLDMGSPTDVTPSKVPPIVIKPEPTATSPEDSVFIGQIKMEPVTLGPDLGDSKPDDHQESQTPGDSLQVALGLPDWAFTSFQPRNHETTKHICAVCGKCYKRKNDLKKHSSSHTGEKPFKCNACYKVFSTAKGLKQHQVDHSGEGFYSQTHLNEHSLYHTGDNPFKCTECHKAFYLDSSLKQHQAIHCGDRPHKCLSCNFSCKQKQMLIVHQRIHHGRFVEIDSMPIQQEKPNKEKHDMCNEGITMCVDSTIHHKADILQKSFQCTVRDKSFSQAGSLKDHQLVHSGERPHICDVCGIQVYGVRNLERHQLLHMREKTSVDYRRLRQSTSVVVAAETAPKPFKYAKSEKACYLDSSWEQHQRVPSGIRPHRSLSYSFYQEQKVTVVEKIYHDPGDNSAVNVNSPLHQEKPAGVKPYKHDLGNKGITKIVDCTIQHNAHILQKPFQCTVCNKAFFLVSDLKQHQRVHSGDRQHICLLCNLDFKRKQTLIAHHRIHHGSSVEILNMLLQQQKQPVGKFPCTVCDKRFDRAGSLKAHQLVHSGEKQYTCDVCGKQFCDISNLERHQLLHTGEKQNEYCGRPRQNTSIGVTSETGEKLFKCTECDKSFYSDSSLKQLQVVHSCHTHRKSLLCTSSFKQKQMLNVHEKKHHNPGGRTVVIVNEHTHGSHQEKPAGLKPYKRDICNKEITKFVDSPIHQNDHILQKTFKCPVCDKAFLSASDLKQHQRVHSGKITHKCVLCNLDFQHKQTLIGHQKIYHGMVILNLPRHQERPAREKFPCTVCDKSFSLAGSLKDHQLVHSGERSHTCDVCGKQFCDISNLERHQLLHTGFNQLHYLDQP